MERTIREFTSGPKSDRWKSVIALGAFGEPALEHLHRALDDDDKWVRFFAADALGSIRSRSSVDPLVQRLLDEDQDVRWVSASALGRIGDPRAAHALQQAGNSDNAFVKVFIDEALEKLAAARIPGVVQVYSQA